MRTVDKRGERELCRPNELVKMTPQQVLERVGLDTSSLPIDMDAVLKHLKIVAAPTNFSPLDAAMGDEIRKFGDIMGMVGIRKGNVVMVYAQNLDLPQQRYTVAHELGHACFHTDVLENGHIMARYTGTLDTEKEKMADAFAAELLLPEAGVNVLFAECLELFGLSEATDETLRENRRRIISYISDKSQVPYYVVEDRLLKLKPHIANCLCAEEAAAVG